MCRWRAGSGPSPCAARDRCRCVRRGPRGSISSRMSGISLEAACSHVLRANALMLSLEYAAINNTRLPFHRFLLVHISDDPIQVLLETRHANVTPSDHEDDTAGIGCDCNSAWCRSYRTVGRGSAQQDHPKRGHARPTGAGSQSAQAGSSAAGAAVPRAGPPIESAANHYPSSTHIPTQPTLWAVKSTDGGSACCGLLSMQSTAFNRRAWTADGGHHEPSQTSSSSAAAPHQCRSRSQPCLLTGPIGQSVAFGDQRRADVDVVSLERGKGAAVTVLLAGADDFDGMAAQ